MFSTSREGSFCADHNGTMLHIYSDAWIQLVLVPDPNQPQHGSHLLDVIRAGVGLGLGPRLGYNMSFFRQLITE